VRHKGLVLLAIGVLGWSGWAALAPIASDSREEHFAIPKGTWARRMSGDPVEILPSEVRLTLGVRDVLWLENQDDVPQQFGPTLLMPGQSFRLPFSVASENVFTCTAHASGQMKVIVEPFPDTPWGRLRWRVRQLWSSAGRAYGAVRIPTRMSLAWSRRSGSSIEATDAASVRMISGSRATSTMPSDWMRRTT
jgi:hypothetical protein